MSSTSRDISRITQESEAVYRNHDPDNIFRMSKEIRWTSEIHLKKDSNARFNQTEILSCNALFFAIRLLYSSSSISTRRNNPYSMNGLDLLPV